MKRDLQWKWKAVGEKLFLCDNNKLFTENQLNIKRFQFVSMTLKLILTKFLSSKIALIESATSEWASEMKKKPFLEL